MPTTTDDPVHTLEVLAEEVGKPKLSLLPVKAETRRLAQEACPVGLPSGGAFSSALRAKIREPHADQGGVTEASEAGIARRKRGRYKLSVEEPAEQR